MTKLIDLNNVKDDQSAPAPDFDWLQLYDLKNGKYSIGFWNVQIKNYASGQQVLDITSVCKTNTFKILENAGFCKRYRDDKSFVLIREVDNILKEMAPVNIKDFVKNMIDSLPDEVEINGFKVKQKLLEDVFLKEHVFLFSENALSPLRTHTKKLLHDKKEKMFFPYLNGVATITKKGIEFIPYAELQEFCIWENHIIQRNFEITNEKSMFEDFIRNACNNDPKRIHAMMTGIGYTMHYYFTATCTKAAVYYDEAITDKDSAIGGTGKGIVAKAIGQMRETVMINGKTFDPNDRFALQQVKDSTQVVILDDIKTDFDFEYFNSTLTDGWEIEKKNKQKMRLKQSDAPKVVIISNSIMKTKKGSTASRRQFVLEFSDFYSKMLATSQMPVVEVHGAEFFIDWDTMHWQQFDNFMLQCAKLYLVNGLPLNETKNVAFNRLLQETCQEFIDWTKACQFQTNRDYQFGEYFNEFKNSAFGNEITFGIHKFTQWLKLYADTFGVKYESLRFNKINYFKFVGRNNQSVDTSIDDDDDDHNGLPF